MSLPAGVTSSPATSELRPFVFGVDVVPVARARQLAGRYDASFAARIGTPGEVSWADGSGLRLGAVIGMKEAAVKAMGGRPEPFVWQQISTGISDLEVVFPTPAALTERPGGWPGPVADVFAGFAAGLELADVSVTTCAPDGPARDRLHQQLGDDGNICGAGCFAVRDDHIFAAVCFWREADDE